jgi:hypothetical protein
MRRSVAAAALTVIASLAAFDPVDAQSRASRAVAIPLDPPTRFDVTNAQIQWVDHRGRRALRLAPRAGHEHDTDQAMYATLVGSDFHDGVIEVDVAGARRAGYSTTQDSTGFKGIIGIDFRRRGDSTERIYLRPENSRGTDQLYRNRSTQYESEPDFPWNRLRQEAPGVYESYVDIEPGAWTAMRIEVSGTTARLFVNGASQPCLIVNDLKLGDSHGRIALWARISSDAYFSNLRIETR